MAYLVVDLETSVRCPIGDMPAHPMWEGNRVVMAGWKSNTDTSVHVDYMPVVDASYIATLHGYHFVVGHNIKFDLLYLFRDVYPKQLLPTIWDTQLAEYLLTGQQTLYASLDALTLKYVGEHALKDSNIKSYWSKGVHTEDIPRSELEPYLVGDVLNTEEIFKQQLKLADKLGMLPLIMRQMDALRATIAMNLSGMQVDGGYVRAQFGHYDDEITKLEKEVAALHPTLDVKSPKQLSLHFFGGKDKVVEKQLVGTYLNGKPKYKNVEVVVERSRQINPETVGAAQGKNGYYATDESVLRKLAAMDISPAEQLLKLREYYKIRDTYYGGLRELLFPNGRIYPQLNHVSTKTGRLSSNKPNLQNQTDTGDVKRAFVSRYKNGAILELDYSQLEMVALAAISEDKQLIDDINNGRDMHRELYKEMYGRYPTDKERKPFKRFSFLLVYGGGISTLMAQSGCDRATAKRFIDTFYRRYKGVKQYHKTIVEEAEANKDVVYAEHMSGPDYVFEKHTLTGRKYVFNAYPNERTGGKTFSPTELKNWPIQGFATGDIVPMMVGILQRNLEKLGVVGNDKAHLVMTVHDSVVLDVDTDVLYEVASLAKETLESAPQQLKTYFDIDFPCNLSVGVDVGFNWQDKEEYLM